MTSSRFLAVVLLLLPAAAFSIDQAAPEVRTGPEAVGAMAQSVSAFFSPANVNPDPAQLSGVVSALQTVGRDGGLTRDQAAPIILSLQIASDRFSPFTPAQRKPAYGLASSVQLELLAGPLKAWLTTDQKEFIPQEQAAYSGKLTRQDQQRLSAKMKAMADALNLDRKGDGLVAADGPSVDASGLGLVSSEKADLWRDHSHLTEHIAQIGQAPDVVSKPGRFEALTTESGQAPVSPASPVSKLALMGTVFLALGGVLRTSLKSARGRLAQTAGVLTAAVFAFFSGIGAIGEVAFSSHVFGYGLGAISGYGTLIALILGGRLVDGLRPLAARQQSEMGPVEGVFQNMFAFVGFPLAGAALAWYFGLGAGAGVHSAASLLAALATAPVALAAVYFASLFVLLALSPILDKGA